MPRHKIDAKQYPLDDPDSWPEPALTAKNEAYHEYRINTTAWDFQETRERIKVFERTNDDRDLGYPSGRASWLRWFDDLQSALEHTGRSRNGLSGVQINVRLNGKRI